MCECQCPFEGEAATHKGKYVGMSTEAQQMTNNAESQTPLTVGILALAVTCTLTFRVKESFKKLAEKVTQTQ